MQLGHFVLSFAGRVDGIALGPVSAPNRDQPMTAHDIRNIDHDGFSFLSHARLTLANAVGGQKHPLSAEPDRVEMTLGPCTETRAFGDAPHPHSCSSSRELHSVASFDEMITAWFYLEAFLPPVRLGLISGDGVAPLGKKERPYCRTPGNFSGSIKVD
ncbi:hypothetical protein N7462_003798 [Penicillium macrosclerotiorum]|uniref:uncharacterized protein n=1 Tax=Penicillium macrosclerotiorum TaxID=303699 RepID=UPI00254985E6|nr:uncharacterized protein N7462_003798 [Penicillium macrosclerotiorum]KAJ5689406.1 hypothetical protein N7462_003798 [Penicillium macrosclerotiorum]